MKLPVFVVIEGIDRCGKSLQAEMLAKAITKQRLGPARVLSTPDYASPAGVAIARHLGGHVFMASVEEGSGRVHRSVIDPLVFECLQISDRYAVAAEVRKLLAAGESVVCARWWQSALLYGVDDGVDGAFIRAACSSLPRAHVNILLSTNPSTVTPRLDLRNRYESDGAKQERLRHAYAGLWAAEAARDKGWAVVDGNGDPEAVAARVWTTVVSEMATLTGTF